MKAFWLGGALALAVAMQAHAADADLPSIPDRPEAELFKDVPAPWRDYLLKARAAERIADPMQRCLAYPDIPGNKWPQGHAAAHCQAHILLTLPADRFNGLLDAGRFDELERQLDALLARHFEQQALSEEIDYVFDAFTPVIPQVDARTRDWLAARPNSAYAHLARGIYLLQSGIDARGGKFIADTPRSQLQRMGELFAQAVPELEQAARMQPKLMPAHGWLVVAAMYDGDSTSMEAAVDAAKKADPVCQTLFLRRMDALRPRWGGSYDKMLSLAGEVSQYVAQRPQLAIYLSHPYGQRGKMMVADGRLDRETAEMLDIAVRTGSDEGALSDGANVAFNAKDGSGDDWKALAYLLQQARFRDGDWWANVNIARMLVRHEPYMALRYATHALEASEDKAASHYYLAAANYNTKRFEEAQSHYLKAADDKEDTGYRQRSLHELVTMWMFDAGLGPKDGSTRAKPYLDRLIRDYPDDGRARLYRLQNEGALDGTVSDEVVAAFEKHADPEDPMQADFLKRIRDARKNPIIRNVPAKAK